MDEAINYVPNDVLHKKNCRYAHSIQRALHLEHLSCCYRGCIVHILHVHVRVDSNVIAFLERQIICFFPVSLCPKACLIIVSSASTLRNPSAFSVMLLFICIHEYLYIYITNAFHTQVYSAFSLSLKSCTKARTYI